MMNDTPIPSHISRENGERKEKMFSLPFGNFARIIVLCCIIGIVKSTYFKRVFVAVKEFPPISKFFCDTSFTRKRAKV